MRIEECFKKGLLKKIIPDRENALRSLGLSKNNIVDAEKNLSIQSYRVVIVSSYTAMFHAARAILFKDGIKERSHECIPIYLKENYPKLEEFANTLDSYRIFRHNAIYGLEFELDEKEAQAAFDSAKALLKKAKSIIKKK